MAAIPAVNCLYVAVSHHGLGHWAQTAPVLNAVRELDPDIRFILRTALPRDVLASRLAGPFDYLGEASDCNLVMHDAIRVDAPASLAAYRAFHRDWSCTVEREARRLEALRVDAVFSNVGYLPLAAAQRAGLPSLALCSLNWAELFRHYLGHAPGTAELLESMWTAYAGARVFLRPEPAMPMADLGNAVAIPPVCQPGRGRRDELRASLQVGPATRLVLLGMGGIPYRPPVERWPVVPGVVFLVPDAWGIATHAMRPLGQTGMTFRDVLASVDALVTKPGYGSYVEAAAAGVPVLTIPRPDWPEAPYLDDWLARVGRRLEIPESCLSEGRLAEALEQLWQMPGKPVPDVDGARVAAAWVRGL